MRTGTTKSMGWNPVMPIIALVGQWTVYERPASEDKSLFGSIDHRWTQKFFEAWKWLPTKYEIYIKLLVCACPFVI